MNNSEKKPILFPIILCGGFGTRLWPLSRKTFPKQFVKFKNNESLLQLTVKNFQINHDLIKIPEYVFVTNEEHRFILENQIKEIGLKNYKIILEPSSKNPFKVFLSNDNLSWFAICFATNTGTALPV